MDPLAEALQQIQALFVGTPGTPATASNTGPDWPGGGAGGSPGTGPTPSYLEQVMPLILQGLQIGGAVNYGGNQLDALQEIYNQQKQAARMAMAIQPGQLGVQAARMAQPLNKQLAYQVTQAADAGTAARGLSQSPGALAAGEAAALAPFEQQNLQTGANLATNANELAISRLNPTMALGAPNYSSVLNQLSTLGQNSAIPPYMAANLGGSYFPGIR